VPLEQLLRESDIVSLHMRLTEETKGILGSAQFALLKPTAFLINTARAALVDRDAMLAALREQKIGGAGLDVFHKEPLEAGDPLLSLPNVVLTPHDSGMTVEVIQLGLQRAVENVERFLFSG
jgi:D-3-phosphoglycerate dehydrogenase / 2-oxoglutarate reductase